MADGGETGPEPQELSRLALSATLHCMTGCGIGEVLGLVAGMEFGLGTGPTVAVSVLLAFFFGYSLTMIPLLRARLPPGRAVRLALASDTVSITIMEIVDNLVIVLVPGGMTAGIGTPLFWGTFALAMGLAGLVVFPVNRWLIRRGRGHAVLHHAHHGH